MCTSIEGHNGKHTDIPSPPIDPPTTADITKHDNLSQAENDSPHSHQSSGPRGKSDNEARMSHEEYDDSRWTSMPEKGWKVNNAQYLANYIRSDMYKDLQKGHLHSFKQRRDWAESTRTHSDRQFWEKADPELDAWMLVTGKLRQVFNLNAFVERHVDIFVPLQQLRKKLNVLVLESRCHVKKALDSARNKARTGNAIERP